MLIKVFSGIINALGGLHAQRFMGLCKTEPCLVCVVWITIMPFLRGLVVSLSFACHSRVGGNPFIALLRLHVRNGFPPTRE
jgi:hypothetical protein